jgi:hypothetical protein
LKLDPEIDKDLISVLDQIDTITPVDGRLTTKHIVEKFYKPSSSLEAVYDICDMCGKHNPYTCITCEPFGVCCSNDDAGNHLAHHAHKFGHFNWKYNNNLVLCALCGEANIDLLYFTTGQTLCKEHTLIGQKILRPESDANISFVVVEMDRFLVQVIDDVFLSEQTFTLAHNIAVYNPQFYIKFLCLYAQAMAQDARTTNLYVVKAKNKETGQIQLHHKDTGRILKYGSEQTFSLLHKGHADVVEITPSNVLNWLVPSIPLDEGLVLSVSTPYQAMERCVKILRQVKTLTKPLHDFLTMTYTATPSLTTLRDTDLNSVIVHSVFQKSFSVVLGFPGTGKTYTAVLMIKKALEMRKTVIYLSTTHVSVEAAVNCLMDNFPELVKDCARNVPPLAATKVNTRMPNIYCTQNSTIHTPKVLFSTTLSSLPSGPFYDVVIVDEASILQDTVWIPAVTNFTALKHLILIGDPYQLSPIQLYDYKNPEAANIAVHHATRMDRSNHVCLKILNIGKRSVGQITRFVSELTYEDRLIPALPDALDEPILYTVCHGIHTTDYGSHCDNAIYAAIDYYKQYKHAHPNWNIAIICTYSQSINRFQTFAEKMKIELPLYTIDSSQGMTVDCVIYSIDGVTEFCMTPARMNVAISRARYKLHVILPSGPSSFKRFGALLMKHGKNTATTSKLESLEATTEIVGEFKNPRYIARQIRTSPHYSMTFPDVVYEGDCIDLTLRVCDTFCFQHYQQSFKSGYLHQTCTTTQKSINHHSSELMAHDTQYNEINLWFLSPQISSHHIQPLSIESTRKIS